MADASPLTTDRVLARRYRLVRHLARGGMAQVWEGHDVTLDRPVAVKVLHPHLTGDPSFVERFRREAVAAARLAHPHIVSVFDTGCEGDTPFIVMELLTGSTLRQILDEDGALEPARAVRIAAAVADALDYAHREGLIHRDVKPGNILCTEDGRVKVADFGIAKAAEGGDLTQTGAVLGTAKYLSPEQVKGDQADARSDVYALGVVLYEMLCGRPPFSAESDVATALLHVHQPALRPRQLRAGIPRPLEEAVMRAMAKDPGARYATAAELRTALLAVDLDDDDATAMVVRDATPPAGISPSFAQSERSWLVPTAIILVVAAGLGVAGLLFARTDVGRDLLRSTREALGGEAAAQAVALAGVDSFDPQGSDNENDDELPLLHDGNPGTAWTTEGYESRALGGLKDGVGVVLRVDSRTGLRKLDVTSPTRGWAAEVYVADQAHETLGGWGQPVARRQGIDGSVAFDLAGAEGSFVLLWITDLGDGPPRVRATIAEVALSA